MPNVGSAFTSHDTVHTVRCHHAELTVVGEHHNSDKSADLIRRVLEEAEPNAIAIESCPNRWDLLGDAPSKGGGVAVDYARRNGCPVILLDTEQDKTVTQIMKIGSQQDEGRDPPLPDEHGDIDAEALAEYREFVQQRDEERFEVLWTRRENAMQRRLHAACRDAAVPEPIVCIVGASHAKHIAECPEEPAEERLSSNRVIFPD